METKGTTDVIKDLKWPFSNKLYIQRREHYAGLVEIRMSIKKYVRNKLTIITSRLARTFLMAKEGDSIPTISDYSQIFSVGSGTVQSAIQLLKLENAIE